MPRKAFVTVLLALTITMTGCVPRLVTEHDGLEAVFVSAQTHEPLADVRLYAGQPGSAQGVLARSDASGRVSITPKRRLEFIVFLGERMTLMSLWACKPGYARLEVAGRMGWNADFRAVTHQPAEPIVLAQETEGSL